jgi:YHS domain-containing protein
MEGGYRKMETAKRIALLCIAAGILALVGTALAEELKTRHPAPNEIGKQATCPVMNSEFVVGKETPVIDYKGKTYYFCCDACIDIFRKDPDNYAKKMEKPK